MRRLSFFILVVQVFLICGMGYFPGSAPEICDFCNREIHENMRAIINLNNGEQKETCCLKCALKYEKEISSDVSSLKGTDFDTGKILEVDDAFFIVGSDVTPCSSKNIIIDQNKSPILLCYDRCVPSILAFGTRKGALDFMKEHGGKMSTFNGLKNIKE